MMVSQDRWLLPEGMEEVLPDEARRLEFLRTRVLRLFYGWGYRLVIPPLIEFLDSLLVGTGRDLDLQTFKLIDQISGRLMGIRADMTPQVARIDTRMPNQGNPVRLCYVGTVIHTQADHLERSRSPMQVGAELYGHAGIASDLEIICLALEMFNAAGITGVHLDLGHVGIYRGLVQRVGFRLEREEELFEILQRKDRGELAVFLDRCDAPSEYVGWLMGLLDMNGYANIIDFARERLGGAGDFVTGALDELEAIAANLSRLYPEVPVNFDLAELRGYHYQTGVVFAAFVPGYGREIARGGRYDDIGKAFGRARPATGFSADLKLLLRLADLPEEPHRGTSILAPLDDDPDLHAAIRKFRMEGHSVIRELPGQVGGPAALGCGFELRRRNGVWQIESITSEPS